MSRSPHPSARILKVYIEAFTGLSHVYCPYGLNTLLSQGCVLKTALSLSGNSGQNVYSKERRGSEEHLIAWVQVSDQLCPDLCPDLYVQVSDQQLRPLNEFPQHKLIVVNQNSLRKSWIP